MTQISFSLFKNRQIPVPILPLQGPLLNQPKLKKKAKISLKKTDNIFANGRKEYVKFSWINSFASVFGPFGITRVCHIYSVECGYEAKDSPATTTTQMNKFTCLECALSMN